MKRVYVAGAYSASNVLDVLENMRRGMKWSRRILLQGYAVFCPHLDYHFVLVRDSGDTLLTIDDYYKHSIAWLEASDAVFVVPKSENSYGVKEEIKRAKELSIPIFYSISVMNNFFKEK